MPFIELESIDSTNNYALTQLHAGLAHHGTAFFAHEQFRGKGQWGKIWTAEKDSSLIISIVIDPQPLLLRQQFQLSACVAFTACNFFSAYAGEATRIKWPNDIYWHDRKAGGILIENMAGNRKSTDNNPKQGIEWLWAVAGVGININQGVFETDIRNPVSLKQITGKTFNTVELAKEFCAMLDKNLTLLVNNGFKEIYAGYTNLLYKKNEPVKLKKGTRTFEAIIKTVTPEGELIIEHGIEESIKVGEIEWIFSPATG